MSVGIAASQLKAAIKTRATSSEHASLKCKKMAAICIETS